MAYACEIGVDGVVIKTIAIPDKLPDGVSFEVFCRPHGDPASTWRRTYKGGRGRTHPRKNFGGPGHAYDETRDAFVPPRPEVDGVRMESWVLDEDDAEWRPPKARPAPDGKDYVWDEAAQDWKVAARTNAR